MPIPFPSFAGMFCIRNLIVLNSLLAVYKYQMEYFYRRTRHRTHTFQFVLFNLNVKVFMPLCLCIQPAHNSCICIAFCDKNKSWKREIPTIDTFDGEQTNGQTVSGCDLFSINWIPFKVFSVCRFDSVHSFHSSFCGIFRIETHQMSAWKSLKSMIFDHFFLRSRCPIGKVNYCETAIHRNAKIFPALSLYSNPFVNKGTCGICGTDDDDK